MVSEPGGAGGEPLGEPPAPPSGILDRMPDEIRRQLPDEVVDELLAGARTEEEIVGPGRRCSSQLTKRLVERAMEVELTDHLGYERHQEPPGGAGNTRNGSTPKTLITEHGQVEIDTPRDRDGSFEPQIVRKRQRRFEGFDDKILALYSRGLSTRDIEAHLRRASTACKVGRDLISRVTDAVMDDARAWQQRPLEDVYPVLFLDALVLKIRDGGSVQRRACYLALGITMDGDRDVLGMWFQETEGAKFWMQVLSELKHRGVRDILICCVDGLKGFPEAIEAVFPADHGADVHRAPDPPQPEIRAPPRIRQMSPGTSSRSTPRSTPTPPTRRSSASTRNGAQRFPVITQAWLDRWEYVTPFLAFPPEVRRVIYTTNAIEALNRQLRKASRPKAISPARTPPASCSTSPSKTPSRHGPEPGTGRPRCWRSRSTSETAYPTNQTRLHRKRDTLASLERSVMPTAREVDSVVRVSGCDPGGAGEPLGEAARSPGILESVPDDSAPPAGG